MFLELAEVLLRPERGISSTDFDEALKLLLNKSVIVKAAHSVTACRDPKDDVVLECAMTGNADWIVTGDRDLLVLHPFHGINIVNPASFLEYLSKIKFTPSF